MLGCSNEEPVATGPSQDPELAAPKGTCRDPYGAEIDEQFTDPSARSAARAKCATILRHYDPPRGEIELAAAKTVDLCHYEEKHGTPPPGEPAGEVCRLFLGLFGIEPPSGWFEDGGYIIEFIPASGGQAVAPNGDFGFSSPGFSDGQGRSLFAFSQSPSPEGSESFGSDVSLSGASLPGGCLQSSPFSTFEECVDWNLIPNDFDPPNAHFGHCAFFPDEFDSSAFRLAKEFDSPGDDDDGEVFGTEGGGIVVLPLEDPPFALSCSGGPFVGEGGPWPMPDPVELRSPGLAAWDGSDASALLAGGKGSGTGGVKLAGETKPIGGTGSSTSDWGIVDYRRDLTGQVNQCDSESYCDPSSDASVTLSCSDGTTGGPVTTTEGGSYTFFDVPLEDSEGAANVCTITADKSGFEENSVQHPMDPQDDPNVAPDINLSPSPPPPLT